MFMYVFIYLYVYLVIVKGEGEKSWSSIFQVCGKWYKGWQKTGVA